MATEKQEAPKAKGAAVEAPAKVKAVAVKKEVVRDEQNGVVRPKDGTSTGTVWSIADKLATEVKGAANVKRGDVIERAVAAGVNPATSATQYGHWRAYNGLKREAAPKTATVAKSAKPKAEPAAKPVKAATQPRVKKSSEVKKAPAPKKEPSVPTEDEVYA